MADVITTIVVILVIGAAIFTVYRNKKNGKCAGCSYSATCMNREGCNKKSEPGGKS